MEMQPRKHRMTNDFESTDGRPSKMACIERKSPTGELCAASSPRHLIEQLTNGSDVQFMDILESNTALLSQRDSLHGALIAVLGAMGLTQEQARAIVVRLPRKRGSMSNGSNSGASPVDSACDLESNKITSPCRSPIDIECDRRVRDAKQPSVFTQIGQQLRAPRHLLQIADSEILAAIAAWQPKPMDIRAIYQLACQNWGIDREPGHMHDFETLERTISDPGFLRSVVEDLQTCPTTGARLEPIASLPVRSQPLLDEIGRKRLAMIACAFEATRGWKYNSQIERTGAFWALYRLQTLLVFPTTQNLAKCPPWFRPLPSQLRFAHPFWIDFIHWPMIREHLLHSWELYRATEFFSTYLLNLHIDFKNPSAPLLSINTRGTDLLLDPAFQTCVDDLDKFSMGPEFLQRYPELLPCVQRHSAPSNNEGHLEQRRSSSTRADIPPSISGPTVVSSVVPDTTFDACNVEHTESGASPRTLFSPLTLTTSLSLGPPDFNLSSLDNTSDLWAPQESFSPGGFNFDNFTFSSESETISIFDPVCMDDIHCN